MQQFKTTGVILSSEESKKFSKNGNGQENFDSDDIDKVLHVINENPHSSISRTAFITGVPKSTTQKILKNHGLFPYKMSVLQQLNPNDYVLRTQMCNFSCKNS